MYARPYLRHRSCPTYCSDIKTLHHLIILTFTKVFTTKAADDVRDC